MTIGARIIGSEGCSEELRLYTTSCRKGLEDSEQGSDVNECIML